MLGKQGEHILNAYFLFQADEDVVAKQNKLPDLHDVARNAVILCAHTDSRCNAHFRGAELLNA